jgi:hypothetical protein
MNFPMLSIAIGISVFVPATHASDIDSKWSEGEHLELGEVGAQKACEELGLSKDQCPTNKIYRKDGKMKFTYGELIAAADYYLQPDALYQDTDQGIKQVIRCAKRLRHDHPTHRPDEPKYVDCTLYGVFFVSGFLEIVSQNYEHFGWHNMKAYVRLHSKALQLAKRAYDERKRSTSASAKYLRQALITNAFADHYLTDGFAAGHVRLPRTQIKAWAKNELSGPFKETRADILAIILHENDGQLFGSQAEFGLKVQNSRGDRWRTRGDQYLRIDENENDPVFAIPAEAIKKSMLEILTAWKFGRLPEGEFSAAELVPFHVDLSLKEKFSEDHQRIPFSNIVDWLHEQLPFFQKIFAPRSDLELMFKDLDKIFKTFRKEVTADLRKDPELKKRLPEPYRNAYQNVD